MAAFVGYLIYSGIAMGISDHIFLSSRSGNSASYWHGYPLMALGLALSLVGLALILAMIKTEFINSKEFKAGYILVIIPLLAYAFIGHYSEPNIQKKTRYSFIK